MYICDGGSKDEIELSFYMCYKCYMKRVKVMQMKLITTGSGLKLKKTHAKTNALGYAVGIGDGEEGRDLWIIARELHQPLPKRRDGWKVPGPH